MVCLSACQRCSSIVAKRQLLSVAPVCMPSPELCGPCVRPRQADAETSAKASTKAQADAKAEAKADQEEAASILRRWVTITQIASGASGIRYCFKEATLMRALLYAHLLLRLHRSQRFAIDTHTLSASCAAGKCGKKLRPKPTPRPKPRPTKRKPTKKKPTKKKLPAACGGEWRHPCLRWSEQTMQTLHQHCKIRWQQRTF